MSKKSKKKGKGCGCLAMFLLLFAVAPVAFTGITTVIDYVAGSEERAFRKQWPVFFDPFDITQDHLATSDYLAALSTAERALTVALDTPELSGYVAHAYQQKAKAQIGLWQYVDAEATLQLALSQTTDVDLLADLNYMLREVEGYIDSDDTERNEQHIYYAAPSVGPAHTLRGKVVIAYVFVDDDKHSIWSLKKEQYVLQQLERVKQWFQARAGEYGIPPLTFVNRIFHYDKDPWLRNAIPHLSIKNAEFGYDLAQRMASLQNERTVNAFLYRLIREEQADQAILLLHVNIDKRSFARSCWTGCPPQAEYAYILKPAKHTHWDATAYVQAHEALHLFGADDLYNLQGGRNYAPSDIMHHYSRYIEASALDSITAFGIGWLNEHPTPTPFPIRQAQAAP